MSSLSTAYLRVASATKTFDGSAAVEDFTLDIRSGEFVSLLGPSGCGKTTLLRMMAGLEFPDRGQILLDGKDITAVPAHKRPVNMVFQRVTLFPHLNVRENIEFGLRVKRVPKADARRLVQEALELVRLPDFAERAVQTLSGGQAQRVALARAIVNRPKVLLFDEPLSALDLQIRRELQVELKAIHRELQGTFVYVTHDQEEAMSMSDRVVVMNHGRIIQAGAPAELYRAPTSLFVASFLGSSNVWPGTVVEHDEGTTVVVVEGAPLRGPRTHNVGLGDEVAIVLRSEAVLLFGGDTDSMPDGLSSLHGTVTDVLFVGPVVHYRVNVGGRSLAVSRPSHENEGVLREGQAVVAAWRPADALILPAGAAATPDPIGSNTHGRGNK